MVLCSQNYLSIVYTTCIIKTLVTTKQGYSMCNMGKTDRIIRAVLGVSLLTAAYFTPYWWLAIIGAVLVGTSMIRFCPPYLLIDLNTGCKTEDKEESEKEENNKEA